MGSEMCIRDSIDTSNPDSSPPFFIHWDVSGLFKGQEYNIRAVAIDKNGNPDPSPGFITITVGDTDFDVKEDRDVTGEYFKTEKLLRTREHTLKMGYKNRITKITVPENSLEKESDYLTVILNPADIPELSWRMRAIGEYRNIALQEQSLLSNNREATVIIPYQDEDGDGVVDGTDIPEKELKLYTYDSLSLKWVEQPGAVLDEHNNNIYFKTNHFSLFGIFQATAENLKGARVYPNPFRAEKHRTITFDRLTKDSAIRIYTLSGDLVWKKEDIDGQYYKQWEVVNGAGHKLASGVYIALISNAAGDKKIIKFAVIR